jgi:LysM repeat protein
MDVLRHLRLFIPFLSLALAVGCASGSGPALAVPPLNLQPYLTATHAITPSSPAAATDIPIPTPTPFTYNVAGGDTLSSIAERFGIRLDDLLAANPGVVAEALSVGQTLKIPPSSPSAAGNPESTPVPAEVGPLECYPSGPGLYCLAPVHNPFTQALENTKLQISLLDANGQSFASREAFLPLNVLPAGSTLPAYAYFPAPLPPATNPQATAQLVTSLLVTPGDARYLPAAARNVLVSIDWNGRSAQVQGEIFLPPENKPAGTVWLAAVAYNANGRIIGFRRWEWQGKLQPGKSQPFLFSVYSLGPIIEKVDVVIEARP